MAKYGAQGTFEWVQHIGGAGYDVVRDGVVDAAGDLYTTGYFAGPVTFGNLTLPSFGLSDGYLAKYSPQGTIHWVQPGGNTGLYDVSLDAAGNPYVVGGFTRKAQFGSVTLISAGGSDVVVAAYTAQGQVRWVQQAGGSGSEEGYHLGLDARGDIYVLGKFSGSCAFSLFSVGATSA